MVEGRKRRALPTAHKIGIKNDLLALERNSAPSQTWAIRSLNATHINRPDHKHTHRFNEGGAAIDAKRDLKAYRNATLSMFDITHCQNPRAVTLTLKPYIFSNNNFARLTTEAASRDLRHFLNVLSRKLLKRFDVRRGRRLTCFPVLEDKYVNPHYHLMLDKPNGVSDELFEILVRSAWHKTTFGHSQVDIRPCDLGWILYITKLRTKRDFIDSIDWENYHSS